METARDVLSSFAAAARARNRKAAQSAGAVAVLLAALLWFTKWPSLRAGLLILMTGYLAAALIRLGRNRTVSKGAAAETGDWFDKEIRFTRRMAMFEAAVRTVGFLVLGYGFWAATGSKAIGIALGLVYPAVAFFSMERRKQQRAIQELERARESVGGARRPSNADLDLA